MPNCEICGNEFKRRVRAAVRAAEGNDPDPWRLYPSRVGGLNPSEATARVTAAYHRANFRKLQNVENNQDHRGYLVKQRDADRDVAH
jgi:hypothetical protein